MIIFASEQIAASMKKRWIVFTYEFEFSVENEALARKLMLLGGKNIELHYKEYFGALPWRGFSKFVVDSIVTKPIGSLPIDSETER